MEHFLIILSYTLPIGIAAVIITKIFMNRPELQSKYYKKTDKIRDDYIIELEDSVKHYKNKASNMERGPSVEGDISELDGILPELLAGFETYAPKWLKPFLKNKDTQAWIIKYATDNPDKVSGWFGKMVKSKGGSAAKDVPDADTI